jgi:hypothetical protein
MNGLPTVPVHDLQIHPRDGEMIAGTHGRSIWVVDIKPLQQFTQAVAAADAHLFEPAPAYQYGMPPTGGEFTAQHYFWAYAPGGGAELTYWLGDAAEEASIAVTDADGNEMWSQDVTATRGVHTVRWNLRGKAVPLPLSPSEARDSIAVERRIQVVADSLIDAGEDREEVEAAAEQLRSRPGGGGGFGGGGGAEGLPFTPDGRFLERPAEGGTVGGGGGGGETSLQQRMTELVRPPVEGRRGRRFRGGGGLLPGRSDPAPMAGPGTYTVTLTIDGDEHVQTVWVGWALSAPSR